MPNGPSAWRAFALHLAPASRAHKLPEAAVRDQQVGRKALWALAPKLLVCGGFAASHVCRF